MLSFFRNNIQSFTVKVIVGIVSLVMIGFGVTSYTSQGVNVIASFDGYEVKVENYQRAYERAEQEVRKSYGQNADDMLQALNLKARVLHQLVNSSLLLKNAEENGLAVTDQELADAIYENPSFHTDNRFDQSKYQDILRQNRISNLVYERELRESLLTQKYLQFIGSGISVSRAFLENEYKRAETKVEVAVLELDPRFVKTKVEVSDDELKTFFEQNQSRFQRKAKYVLDYFVIQAKENEQDVKIRDREIEHYYKKNKNTQFTTKESFHARHILVRVPQEGGEKAKAQAKNKIEKIHRQIKKSPAMFEVLAGTVSEDPGSKNNGGDLGWVEKGTFVPEFEKALEGLKKGQISEPFQTSFGYHLVQLIDKKEGGSTSFEDAKDKIVASIKKLKAARRFSNSVKKAETRLATESFEQIAKSFQAEVSQTQPFDDRTNLPDVGFSQALYQKVGTGSAGETGSFEVVADEKVLVYQINRVIAPEPIPFEEVRSKIENELKRKKRQDEFLKQVQQWAGTTNTKEEFNALAKKAGKKPVSFSFKLSDPGNSPLRVSKAFYNEAYRIPEGKVGYIQDGGKNLFVHVKSKNTDEIRVPQDRLAAIEDRYKREKAQAILSGIIQEMRQNNDILYNDSIIQALDIQLTS